MKSMFKTLIAAAALSVSAATLADGYQIAKNNNCFKCHDVSQEKKGPSFQYVGNAFRGRTDAQGRIQQTIRNGITYYFIWEKMPANHQISDGDLQELTNWVLSQ